MKKKTVTIVLTAAMAAAMLAGCGSSSSSDTAASTAATEAATTAATEAADTAATEAAATDTTEAAAASDSTDPGTGKVYLLNFKPETDEAWQDLAQTYTDQTGIEVNVLTAADGQYNTTLQSEMAKGDDAPTIFNIGSATDAQTWDDYTYDLKDSSLYNHLTDKSLAVEYNGKVAGVANCYECFGIIYNKTILEDYCSMDNAVVSSIDEINSFDTLKAVADDINKRVDEINDQFGTDLTEAFASAGLDDGSSWTASIPLPARLPSREPTSTTTRTSGICMFRIPQQIPRPWHPAPTTQKRSSVWARPSSIRTATGSMPPSPIRTTAMRSRQMTLA